jgi:hypothetical protein
MDTTQPTDALTQPDYDHDPRSPFVRLRIAEIPTTQTGGCAIYLVVPTQADDAYRIPAAWGRTYYYPTLESAQHALVELQMQWVASVKWPAEA